MVYEGPEALSILAEYLIADNDGLGVVWERLDEDLLMRGLGP
jgi:hypothetical protein